MPHRMLRLLSLAAVLPLASCATKFSEAQKHALSTVAVAPGVLAGNSYQEPDGGDRAAAQQATMAGATSGTGAIGGGLGALIGESIAAAQDGMYDSKNSHWYDEIKHHTPNPAPMLSKRLEKRLSEDTFFAGRLRKESPSKFTVTVKNHGLVRATKTSEGVIQVMPRVVVTFSLTDSGGKTLLKTSTIGTGHHHPIETYAKDAGKLVQSYELAVQIAVDAFIAQLSKKTAS